MRTHGLSLSLLTLVFFTVGCGSFPLVYEDSGDATARGGSAGTPSTSTGSQSAVTIGTAGSEAQGGATAAEAECGNGDLEPGELCDDGNTEDGDGCSADCTEQDEDYACLVPGEACVQIVVCGSGVLEGDEVCDDGNTESGDGCAADCSAIEDGWVCPRPGRECVQSPVCGNAVLERGEQCDDANTASGDGCSGTEDASVAGCQLEEGYWCPGAGEACVLLVCGDGERTVDEGCDDGNTEDDDGCSSECAVEEGWRCSTSGCTPQCGDGLLVDTEECDDGNSVSADGCSAACIVEPFYTCTGTPSVCTSTIACGNSIVDPGEVCDPPGADGCLDGCMSFSPETSLVAVCGNSVIETGETCDPPSVGSGCDASCQVEDGYSCPRPGVCVLLPVCGDGTRQSGEECDVGPTASEGCVDCAVTDGWTCYGLSPSVCEHWYCGDGLRTVGEACDDGGTAVGDGCSATCTVETGWRCSSSGCQAVCGDGIVIANEEECDDENSISGDGCSAACVIEPFYACSGAPSDCTTTIECGNEVIDPGEICDPPGVDGCLDDCASFSPDSTDPAVCGDSVIQTGEGCDPPMEGLGCDADCQVEDGFACPRPGVCVALPECGNGLREAGEQCDVGPSASAGCVNCAVTTGWVCFGVQPSVCEFPDCGDGVRQYGEQCDDGDEDDNDGCSSSCAVEDGWICPTVGEDCIAVCGDSMLLGDEECDDGDVDNGDGCNAACRIEPGWDCPTVGTDCVAAVCGNGALEPGEGCDDGNLIAGDGCGPLCQNEPNVIVGPDPTVEVSCGDGMVTGNEECDDGNTESGDGCSGTDAATAAEYCQVEDGFECSAGGSDTYPSSISFSVTLRDVKRRVDANGHPDFEWNLGSLTLGMPGPRCNTSNNTNCTAAPGAVCATGCGVLDAEGKPVFHLTGANQTSALVTSADSYALWYRNASDTPDTIANNLTDTVGANGIIASCHHMGVLELTQDAAGSDVYTYNSTAHFPLDNADLDGNGTLDSICFGTTPGQSHNYNFTTELRYFFQYQGGETLTFRGDDDVWVFINGKHAVDIGGLHEAEWGRVVLGDDGDGSSTDSNCSRDGGATTPTACTLEAGEVGGDDKRFGLTVGEVYEIVLFHAERHTVDSNFRLTLAGFLSPRSYCQPICGDGQVVGWEVCDDGEGQNTGEYGACNDTCTGLTYCGDAIVQNASSTPTGPEECDNGRNLDTYGTGDAGACGPGCLVPTASCGDGVVDIGWEECDNGAGNSDSAYGPTACTSTCTYGPYCGDNVLQSVDTVPSGPELCDLGTANGGYGGDSCTYDCQPGPYCGDGIRNGVEECDGTDHCTALCTLEPYCGDGEVASDEECDYGQFASDTYGGCTDACEWGLRCGDEIVTPPFEECDNGTDNSDTAYDGCTTSCILGPRCGDGITQTTAGEACDNGFNDDVYRTGAAGECGPGCQPPSAYCGDGTIQPAFEECDNGSANSDTAYGATSCTTSCEYGGFCGDGIINGTETCDDGSDNGQTYGLDSCGYDCLPGPRCGDGIRNGSEECDGTEHCSALCTLETYCGDGIVNGSEECDYGQFASDGYASCTDQCEWGPLCGDGNVDDPYEECDFGAAANDDTYGGCSSTCIWGPRCGDGVLQASEGEACDNGFNDDLYAYDEEACASGCQLPPSCGDGVVQSDFELCDYGAENDDQAYNGCTTSCEWGPYCGDGNVDAEEFCDDGADATVYSSSGEGCSYDCEPVPYCGDGIRNGPEECDDGTDENVGGYGNCNEDCTLGPWCGDGVVQTSAGEECDDGPIGSLLCSPTCELRVDVF